MAVLVIQRMQPMFTTEQYDQVNERLGDEPPDGLISHTLGTSEGQAVMADVWESREKFEAFREGRLNPALEDVVGSELFAQLPTPEREFYEVHDHQHS
jgi:hypothetical protein